MNKFIIVALALSMLFTLPSCSSVPTEEETASEAERLLLDYIRREQTGEYGVYTNRLETSQNAEAATGHEVLSESAGLLMRYYAARGDRRSFQAAWEQARELFDGGSGFSYRYSPKLDKRYEVNAAVDDLRIIRALFEGADVFRNSGYRKEAERFGSRLLAHNAADGQLHDFYDGKHKMTNGFLTLCYADMRTLRKLAPSHPEAGALADRLLVTVRDGYLSDDFPFYETRYEYGSGQYVSDGINMVESLLTVLHLAEIGEQRESSIEAVKRFVRSGKLYGRYDKNGKPLNDVRSTALYAIAALIGREVGDDELREGAIARMAEFQVRDAGSALYGGFGDPDSGQAYSFDNLMALLVFASG